MSKAVPITGKKKKKAASNQIPQSLPANFYQNYVPPAKPELHPQNTPKIKMDTVNIGQSLSSDQVKGINIKKTGYHSLTRNQHPMSMPVRYIMGPKTTPFNATKPLTQMNRDQTNEAKNDKEDASSLEKHIKKLKVGSFNCFDVLSSTPLTAINDEPDPEESAVTDASTFNEEPAPDVQDVDEDLFEMD